jgi:hypothetical protein
MTIQILRKNGTYYVRRKRAFWPWQYLAAKKHWRTWFSLIGELDGYWVDKFETYSDAAKARDKYIAQHIAKLTEKISPYVVEDEVKV